MKLTINILFLFITTSLQAQTKVDSLLQSGNYIKAVECLKTHDESADKNNKLAKIYYEIGSFDKAISYYLKSEKIAPNSLVKQKLAKAYKNKGNTKKAIQYYSEIISKDSLNYLLLYQLGKLYVKTKQYKKAGVLFDKLIEVDPNNANFLYQKALLQTDIFERANLFFEVLKLDSLHTKSMFHLANFFRMIHDKDSARLFVNKALVINPNDTKFLPLKINDLYKQKKYKSALNKALQLDSLVVNDVFANQRIGLCYWKLKNYKKAKEYLHLASKYDREEKTTYYYMGLFYKDIKDYKRAKLFFKQAIYHDKPDIDNEYYNLGLIAQIEKKPKEAIKYFKKSFENNYKNYKALFELAIMSDLFYKDKSIALEWYKKYSDRFLKKNDEHSNYALQRIKEIEEKLFFTTDKK